MTMVRNRNALLQISGVVIMTDEREAETAARVVADAAFVAAERVATAAAKAAVESAASAVAAASSASQMLAAVAVSRLDGIDKTFEAHERQDHERFLAISSNQKEIKEELKEDIKDVANDLKDLGIDQKKQTRTITLMTGGIISISTIINVGVGLFALLHNH